MRVLITGGTGLIGTRVVESLAADHDVWSVVRRPAAAANVTMVAGDLSAAQLPPGMPPSADVVIHLAQSLHYDQLPERAPDVFAVNVASTARLLDWAAKSGVRQFILASTGSVKTGQTPPNFYVASRACAEMLAGTYRTSFAVLIARFFFAYGPAQRTTMLIPRLLESVRSGTPITLAGSDGLRLNPVHAADAARAVVSCVTTEATGMIDIAGPDVLTLRQLATCIGDVVGKAPVFATGDPREPDDLVGDTTRMRDIAGPHRWGIRDGLRDVVTAGLRQ